MAKGASAQEEDLHRRTDLFRYTMEQRKVRAVDSADERMCSAYPLKCALRVNKQRQLTFTMSECLYSSPVVVLRHGKSDGFEFLPDAITFKISVVSCAAINRPTLIADPNDSEMKYANDGQKELMRTKIKLILDVARRKKHRAFVLSAFGCGAFPELQIGDMKF